MKVASVCGVEYEALLIQMEEFHGYRSPGILLGGLMLDAALKKLGPTPYLNVVSETWSACQMPFRYLPPALLATVFCKSWTGENSPLRLTIGRHLPGFGRG
jgi:hypothetical protein